jgi:hypothetical protein
MGLRFRKSFPLGGLFRINLSKSGVSLGIGPRGFNVNIGPRGVRRTIGLPGTGISYQDTQSWKQAPSQQATTAAANPSEGASWLKVLIGLVTIVVIVKACGAVMNGSDRPVANATTEAVNAAHSSSSASQGAPAAAPGRSGMEDRKLDPAELRELQTLLARAGYSPGPIDGKLGPRTRAAVEAFRKQSADSSAGDPTLATLVRLRGTVKH